MPPLGRPKKAPKARKENRIVLRVNAAEKKSFVLAAQHAGASGVSTWLRMLAMREVRRGDS